MAATKSNSRTLNSRTFEPIQAGNLAVRLATTDEEIDAAQALHYRVFYQEMQANPTAENRARERDFDRFDTGSSRTDSPLQFMQTSTYAIDLSLHACHFLARVDHHHDGGKW